MERMVRAHPNPESKLARRTHRRRLRFSKLYDITARGSSGVSSIMSNTDIMCSMLYSNHPWMATTRVVPSALKYVPACGTLSKSTTYLSRAGNSRHGSLPIYLALLLPSVPPTPLTNGSCFALRIRSGVQLRISLAIMSCHTAADRKVKTLRLRLRQWRQPFR